jgi:hypothetical protein
MLAAKRLGPCAVAGDDRVEDCHVLPEDDLRHLHVVAHDLSHDPAQIGLVRGGGLADQRICGELVDEGVKAHVRFDLLVQRTAFDSGASRFEIGEPPSFARCAPRSAARRAASPSSMARS